RGRLEEIMQHARERGDQYALTNFRLGHVNLAWLSADDADEARRQADIALRISDPLKYSWLLYEALYTQVQIDLYRGEARRGWERMAAAWPTLRAMQMLRIEQVRIDLGELRARCAIAMTSEADGIEGASAAARCRRQGRLLRFATHEGRRIAGASLHWGAPLGDALRAGVAAARGDRGEARTRLERAALGFAHVE